MDETLPTRWEQFRDLPSRPEVSVFPDRAPRISHRNVLTPHGFKCPRCKYDLTGMAADYCPECGTDLAYEPIEIFSAADLSLVWAAAMQLDQNQISNLIVTVNCDPLVSVLTGATGMPRVMVPFKFFYEAVDVLEACFGKRFFRHGEQPPRDAAKTPWTCTGCNEECPGDFEICWNCGRQRSALP
jgi:hypothetical protein